VEGPASDNSPIFRSETIPSNRKLVWQWRIDTGPDLYYRMYYDSNLKTLALTYNAEWNGSQWKADDTVDDASLFEFDGSGIFGALRISSKFTTTPNWNSGAWDEFSTYGCRGISLGNTTVSGPAPLVTTITMENPEILFLNTDDATGNDSNPPATQGHINRLKAKNVVKMWANITTGGVTDTIQDGFNIASISSSGNTCTVNIQSDMADSSFACVAMCMTDNQIMVYSSSRTTGTVVLKAWNVNTGAQVTLGTTPIVISLILLGKQDS
jgi:hypothetical protein